MTLDTLLDSVEFGLMVLDTRGVVLTANRWLRDRTRSELVGQSLESIWSGQVDPRVLFAVRECLHAGHSMRLSHAFHPTPLPLYPTSGLDRQRLRHAVDVIALQPAGAARQCMLQIRDMSDVARREQILKDQARQLAVELRRVTVTQQELTRQSLRFKEMTRLAPVGLFETSASGLLTYCNERAAEMLGLDPERDMGLHWTDNLPAAEVQRLLPKWNAAMAAQVRFVEEICLQRGAGAQTWLRIEAGRVRSESQHLNDPAFIGTVTDVTEFRQHAQRNEYRANHDVLTGLFNRGRFESALNDAISDAALNDARLAVMFIDLNRFKPVNDVHGHAAGDQVLKTVGARLRHCLRGDDMVARLGGDEFAVLIPNAPTLASLEPLMAKLSRAIAMPVNIGSCHVRVACSVGVAMYPDQGENAIALLSQADRAMYRQKFRERERQPDLAL